MERSERSEHERPANPGEGDEKFDRERGPRMSGKERIERGGSGETRGVDGEHAKLKRESHREKAGREGRQPISSVAGLYPEASSSRAAYSGGARGGHLNGDREASGAHGAVGAEE